MAQLVKLDDIKSIWAQGVGAQNPQNKEHYMAVAILTAKELSIVWGSDAPYWKWISMFEPISCKPLDVAELIEVCWLEIDGKYAADKLVGGKKYRVDFVVRLKDNLVMNGPVTLKLTRPDGSSEEHKEDLEKKPKNEWIRLKVGEFTNGLKCGCGTQEVKFSLNGNDGTTWKKGLVVIGAAIYPCW